MSQSGQIVAEVKEPNPNLKILISSWSPQAYLKSDGYKVGGDNATLDGGPSSYVYSEFADWWADSITAWSGYGVDADYISLYRYTKRTRLRYKRSINNNTSANLRRKTKKKDRPP